jgi:hypothetical protein
MQVRMLPVQGSHDELRIRTRQFVEGGLVVVVEMVEVEVVAGITDDVVPPRLDLDPEW